MAVSEYLLLMRSSHWGDDLSPAELQNAMGQFTAWLEDLTSRQVLRSGQPLADDGFVVSSRKQGAMMDGPFVETKEAVGGYLIFRANSIDQAIEEARKCPAIQHGLVIEVRPIIDFCPMMEETGMLFANPEA